MASKAGFEGLNHGAFVMEDATKKNLSSLAFANTKANEYSPPARLSRLVKQ
jgi:hypothetical protein